MTLPRGHQQRIGRQHFRPRRLQMMTAARAVSKAPNRSRKSAPLPCDSQRGCACRSSWSRRTRCSERARPVNPARGAQPLEELR